MTMEVRPCPTGPPKARARWFGVYSRGCYNFYLLTIESENLLLSAEVGQWKKGSEVAILVRPADLDSDRDSLMKLTNRLLTPRSPQGFDWLYRSNPFGSARAVLAG
jgi:hypothetical protein